MCVVCVFFFCLIIRRPPRSTQSRSSAASDVYKRQVKDLTVSQQQKVEILKMLYRDAEILIFDEPTAVLTPQEIESLINTMKNFSEEGKTIILITHKLNEIKAVADRCTILRRGKYITTIDVTKTSVSKMAELMVGRVVDFSVEKTEAKPKEIVLSINNLSKKLKGQDKLVLNNVSFDIKAGEIVCLAGIDGNGQSELVNVITGCLLYTSPSPRDRTRSRMPSSA